MKFDENRCLIHDKKKGQLIASVTMAPNRIFPLMMPLEHKVALTTTVESTKLWHLRFGHLNYKSLKVLKQKEMVIGLPSIIENKNICEGCIFGKMHRLPFPKASSRAKAPLQLVHADIWGPSRNPTISGKRYFLLFVDDYTRMIGVYFLE